MLNKLFVDSAKETIILMDILILDLKDVYLIRLLNIHKKGLEFLIRRLDER